jgi:hypothetical protein
MKKIVFGLIAMVMFSGAAFAQTSRTAVMQITDREFTSNIEIPSECMPDAVASKSRAGQYVTVIAYSKADGGNVSFVFDTKANKIVSINVPNSTTSNPNSAASKLKPSNIRGCMGSCESWACGAACLVDYITQ